MAIQYVDGYRTTALDLRSIQGLAETLKRRAATRRDFVYSSSLLGMTDDRYAAMVAG